MALKRGGEVWKTKIKKDSRDITSKCKVWPCLNPVLKKSAVRRRILGNHGNLNVSWVLDDLKELLI